ncbi:MAG TPA: hypothetical protein VLM37_05050 [Fibrobacteraceae bacterium]|nr:hypothetical protein [Fibrobacteraceae bacterium]
MWELLDCEEQDDGIAELIEASLEEDTVPEEALCPELEGGGADEEERKELDEFNFEDDENSDAEQEENGAIEEEEIVSTPEDNWGAEEEDKGVSELEASASEEEE